PSPASSGLSPGFFEWTSLSIRKTARVLRAALRVYSWSCECGAFGFEFRSNSNSNSNSNNRSRSKRCVVTTTLANVGCGEP
ncbi:hypothetical protein, partial [Lysobacter sp. Root983]|uniref:hypothetical protein n=1 Tax=Lysobacter sp. Root983 TaxID=1736613 RepID=UPI001F338B9B